MELDFHAPIFVTEEFFALRTYDRRSLVAGNRGLGCDALRAVREIKRNAIKMVFVSEREGIGATVISDDARFVLDSR
jgi:hypothetical protein